MNAEYDQQLYAVEFNKEHIARGRYLAPSESSEFEVLKDSRARMDTTNSIPQSIKDRRQELIAAGKLVEEKGFYRLVSDEKFSSPSNAAGVFLGRSANGRTEWKPINEPFNYGSGSSRDVPISKVESARNQEDSIHKEVKLVLRQGGKEVAKGIVQVPLGSPEIWDSSAHEGGIKVLKGSTFRAKGVPSLAKPYQRERENLFADPSIFEEPESGRRKLLVDHEFNSLSAAASAILGSQANGRHVWNQVSSGEDMPSQIGDQFNPVEIEDPFTGITLCIGIRNGFKYLQKIRENTKWTTGAIPVPYVDGSLLLNPKKEGSWVDRGSSFVKDALRPLGLGDGQKSRWYRDFRKHPRDFGNQGDSVKILGVEAIFDGYQEPRFEVTDTTIPLVLVLHLDTEEEILDGSLTEQLGMWLYGVEVDDFRGILKSFLKDISDVDEELEKDLHYFVTLQKALSAESFNDESEDHVFGDLLSLASLRGKNDVVKRSNGDEAERMRNDVNSRLVEWQGMGGALFKRTGMFVFQKESSDSSDQQNTIAIETSSVYVNAVAIAMLEHLTLKNFLEQCRVTSNGLAGSSERDIEKNSHRIAGVEKLQSTYLLNSVGYGKLHISMGSNTGDIYRALRKRWRTEELRQDISEEITRLAEYVATISERATADYEKQEQAHQQNRDRVISIIFGLVGVVIGAPSLADFAHEYNSDLKYFVFWVTVVGAIIMAVIFYKLLEKKQYRSSDNSPS